MLYYVLGIAQNVSPHLIFITSLRGSIINLDFPDEET
jgi:hypothetical protein